MPHTMAEETIFHIAKLDKLPNFNHAITEEFQTADMESEVLITIRKLADGVQEYTTW